jgi:hypothetical protein
MNESLLTKLDDILKWFSLGHNIGQSFYVGDDVIADILEHYPYFKKDVHYLEIIRKCLKQLEIDGYVETVTINRTYPLTDDKDIEICQYQITFKGLIWVEQNGYRGQLAEKKNQGKQAKAILVLTVVLAIGVITPSLWYGVDLIKKYQLNVFCCFWAVVGLVAGTSITLLMQTWRKSKELP